MGLFRRERQLTFLYAVAAGLSLVTIVGNAVPWNHWKEILDTCLDVGCTCILYGTQTFSTFIGGDNSFCYFTTFASVPSFICAIFMAGYHGYRAFISGKEGSTKTRSYWNGEVIVMHQERRNASRKPGFICWIILTILTCAVSILLIANAVVLTDGYYSTCKEYRQGLAKNDFISGQMAAAVTGRLSCGAIFDLMDYLEPVTRPFFRKEYIYYNHPHEERDFERGPFINTGLSLQAAIGSVCINCLVWIAMFVSNAYNSARCLCSK